MSPAKQTSSLVGKIVVGVCIAFIITVTIGLGFSNAQASANLERKVMYNEATQRETAAEIRGDLKVLNECVSRVEKKLDKWMEK